MVTSSLRDIDNSVWWTFLSCFMHTKTPSRWMKLTAWWPWAYLWYDNIYDNIYDISLILNKSDYWPWAVHAPCNSVPHLAFKKFPNSDWALAAPTPWAFLSHNPVSIDWLCNTFSASVIWEMRKGLFKNNNEKKSEVFGSFHPPDPREL